MNNSFQGIICSAKEYISSGNLTRAQFLLRGALKKAPRNSEICRLLGVIEAISGNLIIALDFFNQAIEFGPKNSDAFSNRGNVHKALGNTNEALRDYSNAIKVNPKNFEAFYSRGLMHESLQTTDLAIQDYMMAMKINQNYKDACLNVAAILICEGKFEDALSCLVSFADRNPYIYEVWLNIGYLFNTLKKYDLALKAHDKALKLNPNDARIWSNKGTTFDAMGLLQDALMCYERAIQLNPKDCAPYSNKGFSLHKQKKYSDALVCFEMALNIDPMFADAWCNKGMSLMELRRFEEAGDAFSRAIDCNSQHATAHLNLGHLLLGLFNFQAGWCEYEWRWKSGNNDSAYYMSSKPLWQGQSNVESIFVWSEQGIGDQILYATLLSELGKYAESITVSTDKKLIPLLQSTYKDIRFIDKKIPLHEEGFDYQIPIASISKFLRPTLNSFLDARKTHLKCEENISHDVREFVLRKIGSNKIKCGVSWFSGNQRLGNDKSVPIAQLVPIFSLDFCEFIDLQYGDTQESRDVIFKQIGTEIHKFNEIDSDDDLQGLLALISACDIVVTVSNTTAHLAAGLGKETLLLLPYSAGRFWYWNTYQGKNLWYDNVISFEQEKQGEWATPVLRVREYIQGLFGKGLEYF